MKQYFTPSQRLVVVTASVTTVLTVGLMYLILGGEQRTQKSYINTHLEQVEVGNTEQNKSDIKNNSFSLAARKGTQAVVRIKVSSSSSPSYGSGVLISEQGLIITNYHVIRDYTNIEVTLADKRQYKQVRLVGYDNVTDLALLQLPYDTYPFLKFSNSNDVNVGDWVLAVGNPYDLNNTVTTGIVSALNRKINASSADNLDLVESFIQTDAIVNKGNSGGALLNTDGNLIGLITAIVTETGKYEGYSFAIPANLVKKVAQDLANYEKPMAGFLGLRVSDMDNEKAEKAYLTAPFGVYVERVDEKSPAQAAGLLAGDVIIELNKKSLSNASHFETEEYILTAGADVSMVIVRDGKKTAKQMKAGRSPENSEAIAYNASYTLLNQLGFELEELSKAEKKQFKNIGVRVSAITPNGKISFTNMDPNFIIARINKKPVHTVQEALTILSELSVSKGNIALEGSYKNYPQSFSYIFSM